ncbi:Zinc finger MYM-type protein 1 [Eumeta japonica]|uniref:Zinc finger MYM-type protein 1 n=1 Tax=Eumeta variegata TaxID=151549 RepID=A0A4C1XVR9_EUMVA|nr:Zinc finger MYM-type protein 1 [Eumeta japonica]
MTTPQERPHMICRHPELDNSSAQDTEEVQSNPFLSQATDLNETPSDFSPSEDVGETQSTTDILQFSSDPFLSNLNEETRDFITMNGVPQNEVTGFKNSRNVYKDKTRKVQSVKYFGVIVDYTPDIAHFVQLTIIIRYVRDNGEIVERLLEFLPNAGHKAKDIEDALLKSLENNGLDIMNCRGQSHDNASNMSDLYSGVQSRIKMINPLSEYVPCAAHSLNLVGACAAESVTEAVDLFSTLQELYNFFYYINTSSGDPSAIYKFKTFKNLSQTRWSARHDACYASEKEWPGVINALKFIAQNRDEKPTTRSEATGLQRKLQHLVTAILVIVWNVILDRFNAASKKLQDSHADLSSIVQSYGSLALFLQDPRETNNSLNLNGKPNYCLEFKFIIVMIQVARKPEKFRQMSHGDPKLPIITKFMKDTSERFFDIAESHPNAFLRSAASCEPSQPYNFIGRPRNVLIDQPDALTAAAENPVETDQHEGGPVEQTVCGGHQCRDESLKESSIGQVTRRRHLRVLSCKVAESQLTALPTRCPRAPKRKNLHNKKTSPPPVKPRRAGRPRTRSRKDEKATAGPRKDPPTNSAPSTSPSENIKALISVISIIDIGEIVLLANKFRAAANPVEKS